MARSVTKRMDFFILVRKIWPEFTEKKTVIEEMTIGRRVIKMAKNGLFLRTKSSKTSVSDKLKL